MEVRINKLLSSLGVCSRREADRLTESGRVTADGKSVDTGERVAEDAVICIDGKPVKREEERVLIAYNKPKGVVCTTTDRYGERDIVSAVGFDKRIYPVGRLDKDSTGLIFLTNIGELAAQLTKASGLHEKEYVVGINKNVTEEFLGKMRAGVYIKELDKKTAPCRVDYFYPDKYDKMSRDKDKGTKFFRIILTQGLNRQIRRMSEACGARVTSLKRIRIMNVELGDLPEGKYRVIEGEEYRELAERLGIA